MHLQCELFRLFSGAFLCRVDFSAKVCNVSSQKRADDTGMFHTCRDAYIILLIVGSKCLPFATTHIAWESLRGQWPRVCFTVCTFGGISGTSIG